MNLNSKIHQKPESIKIYDFEEWKRLGKQNGWRMKCPVCGNIQTPEDFEKLGMSKEEVDSRFYYSCIGRWSEKTPGTLTNKKPPCNYTLGGLFVLNKAAVSGVPGMEGNLPVFEFAEDKDEKEIKNNASPEND